VRAIRSLSLEQPARWYRKSVSRLAAVVILGRHKASEFPACSQDFTPRRAYLVTHAAATEPEERVMEKFLSGFLALRALRPSLTALDSSGIRPIAAPAGVESGHSSPSIVRMGGEAFMVKAFVAILLAFGAAAAASGEDHVYLKRQGDGWVQVRRGPKALDISPAAAPRVPQPRPVLGSAALFEPFTATVTGSWPQAVAIGDVTGDGRNDVALVTSFYFDDLNDYKLFVFRQQPDGTLAEPVKYATLGTYTQSPGTLAIGDVTGDGRNDVVIGNLGMGIGVFRQDEAGGLEPVVMHPTVDSARVRIADMNGDGRLDVVGAGVATGTLVVLPQQSGGTLGAPVTYAIPHSEWEDMDVGDLNHDGRTDVVVSSGSQTPVSVLYQQPDGTLGGLATRTIPTLAHIPGVGVGDVGDDGLNDVLLGYGGNSPNAHLGLFAQQADGTLAPVSVRPSYDIPEAVEVDDADGDGLRDVLVLHGGWLRMGVYAQQGGGALGDEVLYPIPYASHYNPHGLALGDINQDEAPDVVIADYNSGLVVLRHVPWTVAVTAPNTPVVWPIGSTQTITWDSHLPARSQVDLSISRDGGATWSALASAVPDTGSYTWTVAGPPSAQARIRVAWTTLRIDMAGRLDASDVSFTISATRGTGKGQP
jgi:hypothetical protein